MDVLKKLIISIIVIFGLVFTGLSYAACIMPSYAIVDPVTYNIMIYSLCYNGTEYDLELQYNPTTEKWTLFSISEVR